MSMDDVIRSVRAQVESLYTGSCSVVQHQKVQKANKSTGFKEVTVLDGQPCRLSFSTLNATDAKDNLASQQSQVIKLFLAPEVSIPAGAKIVVTQSGVTTAYKASGFPAVHENHQEIVLVLFDGWA